MKTQLSKKKVVLGLSGGVDSTVATLLLQEKGFEVVGCFLDVMGEGNENYDGAKRVAEELNIKLIRMDVSKNFCHHVIDNFCGEYISGRTPNPCVQCNPNIKFKTLAQVADMEGAYYIATGHYAKIYHDEDIDKYFIQIADSKKDQSYMMHRLGQEFLSRMIFPLGEFESKDVTRSIAKEHNMSNAEKADSQEICFIDLDEENYIDYIKERGYESPEGDFIDLDGNVLGRHKGIVNYTIGQRKGLGITLGKPAFVIDIDPEKNTVTLGDNQDLFTNVVYSENNFFVETGENSIPESIGDGGAVMAKIRYAAKPSKAAIFMEGNRVKAVFDQPQRAATPGQSIVFYIDDKVVGGGYILKG